MTQFCNLLSRASTPELEIFTADILASGYLEARLSNPVRLLELEFDIPTRNYLPLHG